MRNAQTGARLCSIPSSVAVPHISNKHTPPPPSHPLIHSYCWRGFQECCANCTEELSGCAGVAIARALRFPVEEKAELGWEGEQTRPPPSTPSPTRWTRHGNGILQSVEESGALD